MCSDTSRSVWYEKTAAHWDTVSWWQRKISRRLWNCFESLCGKSVFMMVIVVLDVTVAPFLSQCNRLASTCTGFACISSHTSSVSVCTYNKLLDIPLHADVGQVWHHVGDHFEAGVLCQVERLAHSSHCVAPGGYTRTDKQGSNEKPACTSLNHFILSVTLWPVGVSGHVFIHTLDPYLQPGAAVTQHVTEVSLEAVVRTGLDGDSHTLGVTALRVPAGGNCLSLLCWCHFITCLHFALRTFFFYFTPQSHWNAEGPEMLGSFTNINLHAASLHGSLFRQLTLTSH